MRGHGESESPCIIERNALLHEGAILLKFFELIHSCFALLGCSCKKEDGGGEELKDQRVPVEIEL